MIGYVNSMRNRCSLLLGLIMVLLFRLAFVSAQELTIQGQALAVCGDHSVLIIDAGLSDDTAPRVIWQWSALEAAELPEQYRTLYFRNIVECKPIEGGEKILVTAARGGVAVIARARKHVMFYAFVPQAHSMALLPRHRLIVAGATAEHGNCLALYNLDASEKPVFRESLSSAHGVVWDANRQLLYALGAQELKAYALEAWETASPTLRLHAQWTIPGRGGHDLQTVPGQPEVLLLTERENVWVFSQTTGQFIEFQPLAGKTNVKSVSLHPRSGQGAYVQAEEKWWAYHVRFFNPERVLSFPDLRVYKARWLTQE